MGYQKIIVNGREVVDFSSNPNNQFEVTEGHKFYTSKGEQLEGKLNYKALFDVNESNRATEYYIPEGVTSLFAAPCFYSSDTKCEKLYVPASITEIKGDYIFGNLYFGSSFQEVHFGDLQKYLSIIPNSEYGYLSPCYGAGSYSNNKVKIYDKEALVTELVLPENCINMGYGFFNSTFLPKITLSSKLVVKNSMFSNAIIYTLIIPENFSGELTSDGFYNTQIFEVYNLSDYDITGLFSDSTVIHTSLDEESSISYEGSCVMVLQPDGGKLLAALLGDIENGELIIPHGVTSVANSLCQARTDITYIEFPETLKSIGEYAFEGCSELADIVLPSSLTYIGTAGFQNCRKLQTVHYSGDISSWCNITFGSGWSDASPCYNFTEQGKLYMNNELITEINIPDNITTIPAAAFYKVPVRTINLNKTSIIGTYAFAGNTLLEQIVLPTTVTQINSSAFYGCTKLVEVYNLSSLALEVAKTTHGYVAYYAKIIHTSTENDSAIFTIDGYKFITGADGVVWLYGCNIESPVELILPTLPNAKTYKLNKNALATQGSTVQVLTIPTSVIEFTAQNFNNWPFLLKVEYLGTLEQWCSITIPDVTGSPLYGFSYSQFKDQAEFWCNNERLIDLVIPSSITTIPQCAFAYVPISTVNLNVATKVDKNAFAYCYKLKSINFGIGAQIQIKDYGFAYTGLESLVIPNNVSYLDFYAFAYNKELKTVSMEGTSKIDFGSYVFQNCSALESVTFRPGAARVGYYMFGSCSALTNVVLTEGMTSMGGYGFWSCDKLKSLTVPSTVTLIEGAAFGTSNKLIITMLSTTPCTLSTSMAIAYAKEIIVPKGSLATYKAATNWSTYASKIKEAVE